MILQKLPLAIKENIKCAKLISDKSNSHMEDNDKILFWILLFCFCTIVPTITILLFFSIILFLPN